MHIKNVISSLIAIALLTACTSVPLSTLWKLRNFDPLEANPSHIQIAVITDKLIQLKDESVSLELGFQSEDNRHTFNNISKATVRANSEVQELSQLVEANQRITLFYLQGEAAESMRLSQNRIKNIRQNDIEGSGHFSVSVNTGCFNGPKPEKLLATVYAKFSPEQDYIKMISKLDLLSQAKKANQDFWVQCENSAHADSHLTNSNR